MTESLRHNPARKTKNLLGILTEGFSIGVIYLRMEKLKKGLIFLEKIKQRLRVARNCYHSYGWRNRGKG